MDSWTKPPAVSRRLWSGNAGCPCKNETLTLASLSDRQCTLPSGELGVELTAGGSCVPTSYGSSECRQHDILLDPACKIDESGNHATPAYCFRLFCYVDAQTCTKESEERIFRSSYFGRDSGVDLFFSYSTCNSTAEDWIEVKDEILSTKDEVLKGVSIVAAVPTYVVPMIYKRDPNTGQILSSPGDEFYDDNVPFEGVYIRFMDEIVESSKGDIRNITYTHRSKASLLEHPTSSFTASIQDIEDGVVDMAVGSFWITGPRLKMTAFTIPVVYDKTILVIPQEGSESLNDQIGKVMAPFSYGLWLLVMVIIIVSSCLSVCFNERPDKGNRRSSWQGERRSKRLRIKAFARLWLDAFIEKGLFFCSAGVEKDEGASLPQKILMFGFGFFILIAVSAYVANLAAFLTRSSVDINTMEGSVEAGWKICAHPAVEAEMRASWPDAQFYFHQDGNEFHGMLDDYLSGKCKALAVSFEDTHMDASFLERMCNNSLVFTESMVTEIPIALPIREELASGLSYWIYQGERNNEISLDSAKKTFHKSPSCDVYAKGQVESSEDAEITVKNMFLPLLVFFVCTIIAVILQIIRWRASRQGQSTVFGRMSTIRFKTDKPLPNPLQQVIKRRKPSADTCSKQKLDDDFDDLEATAAISITEKSLRLDHYNINDADADGFVNSTEATAERPSGEMLPMTGQSRPVGILKSSLKDANSDDMPFEFNWYSRESITRFEQRQIDDDDNGENLVDSNEAAESSLRAKSAHKGSRRAGISMSLPKDGNSDGVPFEFNWYCRESSRINIEEANSNDDFVENPSKRKKVSFQN